jgi:hypothetical protein
VNVDRRRRREELLATTVTIKATHDLTRDQICVCAGTDFASNVLKTERANDARRVQRTYLLINNAIVGTLQYTYVPTRADSALPSVVVAVRWGWDGGEDRKRFYIGRSDPVHRTILVVDAPMPIGPIIG